MIVVLEGPDNAGKSTLAKKLSLDTGMEVCHPGGPPKDISLALARCMEQSFSFAIADHIDFIYDRITCISDRIYRGNSQYHEAFDHIRNSMFEFNVIVIFCFPSEARLRNFEDHVTKEHETDEVVQHAKRNVDRIISEYANVMSVTKAAFPSDTFIYNFETDIEQHQYRALLEVIRSRM